MECLKTETLNMTCQSSNQWFQSSNTTKMTPLMPLITLPYPPIISASDIINRRTPSRVTSKSPNAFLIYRKAFLDQLFLLNHNLRMTDVSKLVSIYWKNEPEFVKDSYREIAQEVEKELNEKRKKNVPYRVVWKNSKYSSIRKRKRFGKMTIMQGNKPETVNSKPKSKTTSNCGNIFYQFVPACPSEFTSKSSKKNNKEVTPKSDTKSSYNSFENSWSLEQNETFNEHVDYPVCNDSFGIDQSYLQFIDNSTNFNIQPSESFTEQPNHLILNESIQKNHFYDLGLDWHLQNFYHQINQ